MSKESKPRDRWSQVFTAAADRPNDYCKGCGYHHHVTGGHRADCTSTEPPCSVCLYYPAVNGGQHRGDCAERRAA